MENIWKIMEKNRYIKYETRKNILEKLMTMSVDIIIVEKLYLNNLAEIFSNIINWMSKIMN